MRYWYPSRKAPFCLIAVLGLSLGAVSAKQSATVNVPLRLAKTVEFLEVVVPPVDRSDPTLWVSAGTLNTDEFPEVVLSFQGQVQGNVTRAGEVAAVLIPDEGPIRAVFDEQGIVQFGLEVSAPKVSRETPYFSSGQPRYSVGFEAYDVLLLNTTDRTVTVNLFVHLTN